jgi:hypothetical protein
MEAEPLSHVFYSTVANPTVLSARTSFRSSRRNSIVPESSQKVQPDSKVNKTVCKGRARQSQKPSRVSAGETCVLTEPLFSTNYQYAQLLFDVAEENELLPLKSVLQDFRRRKFYLACIEGWSSSDQGLRIMLGNRKGNFQE